MVVLPWLTLGRVASVKKNGSGIRILIPPSKRLLVVPVLARVVLLTSPPWGWGRCRRIRWW
jgi:hypothetical protein